jgi:hypothetical protein
MRQFTAVKFAAMGQGAHRGHAPREENRLRARQNLSSSIASQLPPTKVRGFGIGRAVRWSVEGAFDSHLGEQHWSAIFGSIDQHLDRQPALRRVAL